MGSIKLNYKEFHENGLAQAPLLVILHGLLGSSTNWSSVARELAQKYHVLNVDLINHGLSPHSDTMDYQSMAAQVLSLLSFEPRPVTIMGHSMGGKVAMWLALNHPERVEKLVVVDIAPVTYEHDYEWIFAALKGLDLAQLKQRKQADEALMTLLPDPMLRGFLLQNLTRNEGRWSWRMNLPVIHARIKHILGFPSGGGTYIGPSLFIAGELSEFISATEQQQLCQSFTAAQVKTIKNAGHWVHAEQPQPFMEALWSFL
ncbi:MAG: alpha/beta fold hydrolase [Gammaproteobacteria bacterium]|nr:alpha/beta fold hydrolase [Gammaproteobacteria bacterium]